MEGDSLKSLSDAELLRQLKKYRLITLIPLGLGLLVTVVLIWLDQNRTNWSLFYFLLIVVLLPWILKSGRLHREKRRRHIS